MQVTPLHENSDAGDVHAVTGFAFSTVDITPSHRSREALIDTGIALSRTIALDRVFHEVGQQVRRAIHCEAFVIDAAPEASDLTLASTALPNGAWRCRLTNGGPAIPVEALARVFEIFYSSKPGGTGIGLALCQRIVEEHRGTIALESIPEYGTTVTITLPPA